MARAHTHHRRSPQRPLGLASTPTREALVRALTGGRAHTSLVEALRKFPRSLCARKPRGAPHTPWELLEHLRIAQRDILDFSRDPEHTSPAWPAGFWPPSATPPDARAWARSVKALQADLRTLVAIARDPKIDLAATIPGTTTTWLAQLLLVASHGSYHLGQLLFLRRTLEASAGRRR